MLWGMCKVPLRLIILFTVVVGIFVLAAFGMTKSTETYPEVAYLAEHPPGSFKELSSFFEELATSRGAVYAFSVLREATLPTNTDTHLLAHVVGDVLYEEIGVGGIGVCTDEFRNACSHSLVIGVLTDEGDAGLPRIAEMCRAAPGGRGAYSMCFHGLGHGVFAYTLYDLPAAVRFCSRVGTPSYGNREYIECVGGIVMELVGGTGGHDPEHFKIAQESFLSAEDPLTPCSGDFIPPEVKSICYTYLTPRLFTAQGGDLGHPGEREFTDAFLSCERIPKEEKENRNACFGGIGKELPTLVQARDIRRIDALTQEQLSTVSHWCALGGTEEAEGACSRAVAQSLFWGGENDPRAATAYCGVSDGRDTQAECYQELVRANAFYHGADAAGARVCSLIPRSLKGECERARLEAGM